MSPSFETIKRNTPSCSKPVRRDIPRTVSPFTTTTLIIVIWGNPASPIFPKINQIAILICIYGSSATSHWTPNTSDSVPLHKFLFSLDPGDDASGAVPGAVPGSTAVAPSPSVLDAATPVQSTLYEPIPSSSISFSRQFSPRCSQTKSAHCYLCTFSKRTSMNTLWRSSLWAAGLFGSDLLRLTLIVTWTTVTSAVYPVIVAACAELGWERPGIYSMLFK